MPTSPLSLHLLQKSGFACMHNCMSAGWKRMAVAMVEVSMVLCALAVLATTVRADYNCSRPDMIIETYSFDFLRTFSKAAVQLKAEAPKAPDHFLNLTLASRDTRRNVSIWSQCSSNDTEKLCQSCIGVLLTNIYECCCAQKSAWGSINLRSNCYVGYSTTDYVITGWTDPADLPKNVEKEPNPLNLNAAAAAADHILSFPALLLFYNTFVYAMN